MRKIQSLRNSLVHFPEFCHPLPSRTCVRCHLLSFGLIREWDGKKRHGVAIYIFTYPLIHSLIPVRVAKVLVKDLYALNDSIELGLGGKKSGTKMPGALLLTESRARDNTDSSGIQESHAVESIWGLSLGLGGF